MDSEVTTEVLPTHTPALFASAVKRTAELLRRGELAAVPTETVYGLAANALDAKAVARIFETKGRPADNPIIVHVAGLEMARRCVAGWPQAAQALAESFWPGPLTLVLPRSNQIPDIVTAGGGTVGVRWPSHPFIQALIQRCGFPLAAPSANPSEGVSPTSAEHVRRLLGGRIPLIVDGGQSQVGIESTVVDLTVRPPRVLRPGMVHAESLLAALSQGDLEGGISESQVRWVAGERLRSPGLLQRHYSPRAPLRVLNWRNEADLQAQTARYGVAPSAVHVIAHTRIPMTAGLGRVSVIPHDAEAFARAIYAELHQCDEAGAGLIVVEALPEEPEWHAIRDRLSRAEAKE